ncbi:MAG TPA: hypothetical protein VFD56_07005 [Chitinophagaceae bacterium]|nr:hypothetical protein [Chitinophagaceae bacterium]
MEKYELIKDINVAYVPATSFPEGIKAAFEQLESLIPPEENRTVFGLSWPDKNGKIMYKAAVEEKYKSEGNNYGLESFVIKKGSYMSELVENYAADLSRIGDTFQQLLKLPDIDPKGYCLEWYKGCDDVLCLVKLNSPEK